jgi:hypothetical protein
MVWMSDCNQERERESLTLPEAHTITAVGVDGGLSLAVVVGTHEAVPALRVVDLAGERAVDRNLVEVHAQTVVLGVSVEEAPELEQRVR